MDYTSICTTMDSMSICSARSWTSTHNIDIYCETWTLLLMYWVDIGARALHSALVTYDSEMIAGGGLDLKTLLAVSTVFDVVTGKALLTWKQAV